MLFRVILGDGVQNNITNTAQQGKREKERGRERAKERERERKREREREIEIDELFAAALKRHSHTKLESSIRC